MKYIYKYISTKLEILVLVILVLLVGSSGSTGSLGSIFRLWFEVTNSAHRIKVIFALN